MSTKSFVIIVCMWLFAACFAHAQMPQAISYQAVARDAQGKVVSEKTIGVKVEILKGSASGAVVFSETHSPTSSKTGTVNLLIGQGTAGSGTFASVDWGADTYYLQLKMDLTGGTNFQTVSTTQMLPVPYALYAAKAGVAENGGSGSGGMDVARFLIISEDDSEELTVILSGGVIKKTTGFNSETGYFIIDANLLYLSGVNQYLSMGIENWPNGSEEIPESDEAAPKELQSTTMGRFYRFSRTDIPVGVHNLKMVVKDKDGVVLKEYPFKLEVYKEVN